MIQINPDDLLSSDVLQVSAVLKQGHEILPYGTLKILRVARSLLGVKMHSRTRNEFELC